MDTLQFVFQAVMGVAMLLLGVVLQQLLANMKSLGRDLKQLNDAVLAHYVQRPELDTATRDLWTELRMLRDKQAAIVTEVEVLKRDTV